MRLSDTYRALARYNTWMNQRIYALCAGKLDDEQRRRALGAFFGSIHGTLNHLLLADRAWMARFTRDKERFTSRDASGAPIEIRSLGQELYADFEQLREERAHTDADIEAWAGELTDDVLEQELSYRSSLGGEHAHPSWWAVTHFFNHQTHHRGQVTAMMTRLGVDPGVTDFAVFMREGG